MLEPLIRTFHRLFYPEPDLAKKHEWSIADDMRIRARYSRETGADTIYISPDEFHDVLCCTDLSCYRYSDYASLNDPKAPYMFWEGIPVRIKVEEV